MNKVLIRYILVKNDIGLVEECKFIKELDLDNLPSPGDKITNFYNQEKEFYNLFLSDGFNQKKLLNGGNLVSISEDEALEKIKPLLQKYIGLLESSKCEDIISDVNGRNVLNEIKYQLSYLEVENVQSIEFSKEEYKNTYNELRVLSLMASHYMATTLNSITVGINTLLANDNKIEHDGSSNFYYMYDDDSNENSEKILSTAEAISKIAFFKPIPVKVNKLKV